MRRICRAFRKKYNRAVTSRIFADIILRHFELM